MSTNLKSTRSSGWHRGKIFHQG